MTSAPGQPDLSTVFADLLDAALARRAPLADLGCYRLFHGYGEGLAGLEVDRYGEAAVIRARDEFDDQLPAIAEIIAGRVPVDLVTARRRGFGAEPQAIRGEIGGTRVLCRERHLSFLLDFGRAGNPGLFLDARPAREWIGANAAGRRVLNLFAFTGSLGIAAAVGGAERVTHLDSHGPTLAWARANCEANGLAVDDRDFARMNVYQHLRKNEAGRQRFGAIIIDPPPGPRSGQRKDRSPGARGPAATAALAARMLEPGGWLLCLFHHDGRPHYDIDAEVAQACELEILWRGTSGLDFPDRDLARLRMTAFVNAA